MRAEHPRAVLPLRRCPTPERLLPRRRLRSVRAVGEPLRGGSHLAMGGRVIFMPPVYLLIRESLTTKYTGWFIDFTAGGYSHLADSPTHVVGHPRRRAWRLQTHKREQISAI